MGWRDGSADKGARYPSLMAQVQFLEPTKKPDVMAYIYKPSTPMIRWIFRRVTQKSDGRQAHRKISKPQWGQLACKKVSEPTVRLASYVDVIKPVMKSFSEQLRSSSLWWGHLACMKSTSLQWRQLACGEKCSCRGNNKGLLVRNKMKNECLK